MTRTVDVAAARVPRWVENFAERHGAVAATSSPDALELCAADGATAVLRAPFAPWTPAVPATTAGDLAVALAEHLGRPRRVAVLVVRRGGFAAALVDGGRVTASKVGRRHVQGRTAAGGWSQQRFARRREKQTNELADAAAATAARILASAEAQWLVTGGDRPLVEQVLGVPALRALAALPRGPHLAVGDPDGRLVPALPELLTRVPVLVGDPTA